MLAEEVHRRQVKRATARRTARRLENRGLTAKFVKLFALGLGFAPIILNKAAVL